ncbi:MAG TPA: AMP-binding protein [Mycobacteriales bacterium]|jgi:long-chain acyl-CoA synthetase|nr:AMP-binding protein [Mycobacteriales bacterium]
MTRGLSMAGGVREFGRSRPHAPAVRDQGRTLTFAQLDDRSNRLAQALLTSGLQPGEPVAVLSGNRAEYVEVITALAKAGLPMVPLNSRNAVADNAYALEHSGARGLLLDGALAGQVDGLADTLTTVLEFGTASGAGVGYEQVLATARGADPRVAVAEDDAFCITYTSGTTGRPKGVVLTHRARVLTAMAAGLEYGLGPGRRTLAVAPMYHGAGMSFAFAGPQLGGCTTILRSWDPELFLRLVVDERIETTFLVPTHAQQIRRLVEEPAADHDLSALHTLYFNAAALPVALKQWVLEAFPGVGVHELYGSTECGIVTDLRPEDALRKAGSVGHPWFGTQVRLLDLDGQPVGPGQPGELWASSPMLMKGYLRDPDATAAATSPDGFITVGDVAVADEEGFLSIVDRTKDMIISGGVNIYPREIEEVLAQFPDVHEAAVVGLPDETYGERVVAFVVTRSGEPLDVPALEEHVRARVARYKVPREWRIAGSLPRNPSGKILKRELRQAAAGR